jgi:hypothetical protein
MSNFGCRKMRGEKWIAETRFENFSTHIFRQALLGLFIRAVLILKRRFYLKCAKSLLARFRPREQEWSVP